MSYCRRHVATGSRAGRPPRFTNSEIVFADRILGDILDRETSGRVSIRSFSDHYLRIPGFPSDVEAALAGGQINLAEAEQLVRITARSTDGDSGSARMLRARILHSHAAARSGEPSLRHRVTRALAELSEPDGEVPDEDAIEDSEPSASHFFLDVLTTISHAIKVLGEGAVSEDAQERIYEHGDQILLILRREEAARARGR